MSRTLVRLALAAAVGTASLAASAPAHANANVFVPPCQGYITINDIQAPAYANCMVDFTVAVTVAELTCVQGYDPLTPATLPNAQSETDEYVACAA